MGSYRFDFREWPLAYFIAEGEITRAQLDEHLREHVALLERSRPYAIVIDLTKLGGTDAFLRKRYAEFMMEHKDQLTRLCKGGAIVINSAIVRGTLTAVLWLTPLPYPYKIFSDLGEARQWAMNQILG